MNERATGDDHRRPVPGTGGLYGRRTGRKLHRLQSDLMADMLPGLAIPSDATLTRESLFPDADDIRLEIGFGGGEHLVHHAASRPTAGFIGCEPFRNGVAKFLEAAADAGIGNVRVDVGDAALLLARMPEAWLAGADIFYPDPWPKRRQRKRRFVSDDTLRRLARVLQPGAALRFATDIDDYAGWTLARVLRAPYFRWNARSADDWRRPWSGWPSTRYEAKAFEAGRQPVYLTFIRTDVPVEKGA